MGRPLTEDAFEPELLEAYARGTRERVHEATAARGHGLTTPRPRSAPPAAVGSWGNPRVRRDGVQTRSTSVHLPIDLAKQVDEVRVKTHRRLSDILAEALREWFARRAP